MIRKGSAVWQGDLRGGAGKVSTESGALCEAAYYFGTRFENEKGANPEELIAAAHAACFSMALSGELGKVGITPQRVSTTASVTLDMLDKGPTVTEIHLDTTITAPGADKSAVIAAAEKAKSGCPISRLLNAKITMDAKVA